MHLEALPAVTNPGLAEITNSADHGHSSCEHSGVSDQTVARLQHALHLATLCTDGQTLNALAEIAEGTGLLLPGIRTRRVEI